MPVFLQYCTMGATEAEAKCLPIRSRSNILINNSTCSMHGPEKMREKVRIPKVTMISLGVSDLAKATAFYGQVLETAPNTSSSAITFIELPGTWLALYPLEKLAECYERLGNQELADQYRKEAQEEELRWDAGEGAYTDGRAEGDGRISALCVEPDAGKHWAGVGTTIQSNRIRLYSHLYVWRGTEKEC